MTSNEQLERIRRLIADQQGYPIERINADTRLQTDVGMAGDDGEEFLERFQSEFGVDMSTLRYGEHFEPEGLSFAGGSMLFLVFTLVIGTSIAWIGLIPVWAIAIYFYFRHRSRVEHPGEIRVTDLLRSAEAGQWSYHYK